MENSQCEPCRALDKNKTPTHWCVICEEALCLECSEHHRVQKISRNHELLDINTKPININISDQRCSKHENLSFEYFCVDHDSLCCKECQVESHRSCQKIMSVDVALKGIKRSQSFIDAVELIEHVLMTIPIITEDRQTLIDSIEKDANVIKDEIRKVKEEAISHIEYLEKLLLGDLKLKKDKIVTNAKVTINEIEDIKRMTKEEKDTFDIVEKHGSEKQAFLTVHGHKTVLTGLEHRTSTITENTTNLSMKLNTTLPKPSIMSIMSIGTIDTIEVPTAKEFIQRKKRQSQIPIVQEQILPVFIEKQGVTVKTFDSVKGITVNHNNELIISTDDLFGADSIKVYDNNEKFNYEMEIRFEPWQIVSVPDHNRGIIWSGTDTIQFVDFNTCKLLNDISIEGCKKGGVAASNENIFVGTKGNIKVLDLNGRHIRSIKLNNNESTPRYIALDKSVNIYHSDSEVVYCTRIDGENIFTFKPPDNKSPNGIAIDSQGYVYVVVKNQGVCRLKPDGTFSDLMLNEDLDRPFGHICFNNDCTKLYISYENGVSVYNRQ